jgi:hypothetical protein
MQINTTGRKLETNDHIQTRNQRTQQYPKDDSATSCLISTTRTTFVPSLTTKIWKTSATLS